MIFGLRFEVTAEEARDLLRARSDAFRAKAAELEARLPTEAQPDFRDILGPHTRMGLGDAREVIEMKVRELKRTAEYFTFLADHVANESYQLQVHEAAELFGHSSGHVAAAQAMLPGGLFAPAY